MRADYMMMYSYNRERSLFITHAYGLSTEVWCCPILLYNITRSIFGTCVLECINNSFQSRHILVKLILYRIQIFLT